MSEFFGPLDSEGRVPPRQQTRVAAFLISAHGALARQFAFALPVKLESAWQTELNAQFYREIRDRFPVAARDDLGARPRLWAIWLHPGKRPGFQGRSTELRINPWRWRSISQRAHMPCMLASGRLPCCRSEVNAHDPFVMALRRIEFESSRLLQAQIMLAEGPGPRAVPRRRQLRPRKTSRRGSQIVDRSARRRGHRQPPRSE